MTCWPSRTANPFATGTTAAAINGNNVVTGNDFIELAAARIRFPSYYTPPFTAGERELIEHYTADARALAAGA